jgi:DNA polymerase-3 subunit delta
MANVKEYTQIMHDLKSGKFHPLYLLHGEEAYYIDRVSKYIEEHGVEEHERDFNLSVFYGRDVSDNDLLESVKRFPMMAERQVVILREAQDFQYSWDKLEAYFSDPIPSTVFVIDHKYKKVDERKKWVKLIKKSGVVFNSSKHYDNELPQVVTELTKSMKYRINPSAAMLMAEYLGNDLEKIEGELKKLMIKVPLSQEIEQNHVRENIGISKEFSAFDLVDALAVRDAEKSFRVAHFIGLNDKSTPFVVVVGSLFNHFSKVLMYQMLPDKNMQNVVRSIPGVTSPWFARKVIDSAPHFTPGKTTQIIEKLREMDDRFKGVGSNSVSSSELLKELTYFIIH